MAPHSKMTSGNTPKRRSSRHSKGKNSYYLSSPLTALPSDTRTNISTMIEAKDTADNKSVKKLPEVITKIPPKRAKQLLSKEILEDEKYGRHPKTGRKNDNIGSIRKVNKVSYEFTQKNFQKYNIKDEIIKYKRDRATKMVSSVIRQVINENVSLTSSNGTQQKDSLGKTSMKDLQGKTVQVQVVTQQQQGKSSSPSSSPILSIPVVFPAATPSPPQIKTIVSQQKSPLKPPSLLKQPSLQQKSLHQQQQQLLPTTAQQKLQELQKMQELPKKQDQKPKEEEKRELSPEMQVKLSLHISKLIQQKKIFAMAGMGFPTIRAALMQRGWIQKFECEELPSLKTGITPQDPEAQYTNRSLKGIPPNFIWVYNVGDWNDIKPYQMVNKFPRQSAAHSFTTKIGLNHHLQQSHWYNEVGVACVRFPRTYSIVSQDDLSAFVEDYVRTACTSLLKLVVGAVVRADYTLLKDGDVPVDIIDYAINRCNDYAEFREHRDIDKKGITRILPNDKNVKYFLYHFYRVVQEGATFETAAYLQMQGMYLAATSAMQGIQRFWPQMKLDGYKNLWLLKQSNLNCGKGVKILSTLEEILEATGEIKNSRYVIQKYIERPLLIYDTKFDIRQWVLLTSINPIQIWMYSECYLRFSSQIYSLSDTSESVHLCNNVIQRKYKNSKRHPDLPHDNMWDSKTFQKYLADIGQPDKWEKIIYPGMKQGIIATIMAAQEDMIDRVNSFELYGVDFMVAEDYQPWLIEINSSPAMGPTTSVTSRLCSQCLGDVIKVVVDRRHNPSADTGQFRLVYKQESIPSTYALASDFQVVGKKISLVRKSAKNVLPKLTPPVTDITKTPAGKQLALQDTPSSSVMTVLIQKPKLDWLKDIKKCANKPPKQEQKKEVSKTDINKELTKYDNKSFSENLTSAIIVKHEDKKIAENYMKNSLLKEIVNDSLHFDIDKKRISNTNNFNNNVNNNKEDVKNNNNSMLNFVKNNTINKTEVKNTFNENMVNNEVKPKTSLKNVVKNNVINKVNVGRNFQNDTRINNLVKAKVSLMNFVKNNTTARNNETKISDNRNQFNDIKNIAASNDTKINATKPIDLKFMANEPKYNTSVANDVKNNLNKTNEIKNRVNHEERSTITNTNEKRGREFEINVKKNNISESFVVKLPNNKNVNENQSHANEHVIKRQEVLPNDLINSLDFAGVRKPREAKPLQYKIYYNKDKTHFIVDVLDTSKRR